MGKSGSTAASHRRERMWLILGEASLILMRGWRRKESGSNRWNAGMDMRCWWMKAVRYIRSDLAYMDNWDWVVKIRNSKLNTRYPSRISLIHPL